MPVSAERRPAARERTIRPVRDLLRRDASGEEMRLLAAARPALPLLLGVADRARPLMRVPGLGWVTGDPQTARELLNNHQNLTLLGEGGVGHLWAQILGDWVNEMFDGAGHHDLRTRAKDLFTDATSSDLVRTAWSGRLEAARETLETGGRVDVADLARVLVGRMVATLLGMSVPDDDDAYRHLFATGERLALTALGSTTSTHLTPQAVAEARAIIAELTGHIPAIFSGAPASTVIGRCRELGLSLQETTGLATLLLIAGSETASSAVARTIALLVDTGEQHRLLADPALLEGAVREGLRVTSPAPMIGRAVSSDVEVAGRTLRAGDRVLILVWTANNGLGEFDITRPYSPHHRQLWFGAGRHLCLGAPLAKAELGGFLEMAFGGGEIEIVERRRARRVFIPHYESLVIARRR